MEKSNASIYCRRWRKKNPEKSNQSSKNWKKNNPEKVKQYREDNKEKMRQYQKIYRANVLELAVEKE